MGKKGQKTMLTALSPLEIVLLIGMAIAVLCFIIVGTVKMVNKKRGKKTDDDE